MESLATIGVMRKPPSKLLAGKAGTRSLSHRHAGEENAIAVVASMQRGEGIPPNVTEDQIQELLDSVPDEAMKAGLQTFAWGKRAARAIGVESDTQVENSEQELLRIFTEFLKSSIS